MKKSNISQRLLSLLLCLVLIAGHIPLSAGVAAAEAAPRTVTGRVADAGTMDGWQAYFGPNVMSTEFAGGVWTDKSVFTNSEAFRAEITMDDPGNNFLIALSAIAANQQITGYSSAPVDVMLVLDVSGSMEGEKATTMVQAANQALESLIAQNNNNRVGVVLYSGNNDINNDAGSNTATVILPLDRYTTTATQTVGDRADQTKIPAYLKIEKNKVSVADGVKNSNGTKVTGNKNVTGGTYIQNGIYKAWGEFSKVTDVKVPAGQAQAGAQRTPVMVLLSDGQPTLATTAYSNVGTSQSVYGDGQESNTTWKTVFLTQLTAAWAKGKMAEKYGTDAMFYTLGLGTGNSQYATAVLNPASATNNTLAGYWDNYFNNASDRDNNVTVFDNVKVAKDSHVQSKNYVDLYKLAANSNELLDAFRSIVESIELDAAGHVTLVGSAGEDLSGYITFADELGCFMEVKDVKGLVMGSRLYTGHDLAEVLDQMGTLDQPTAYGDEFIRSICDRLAIQNSAAQSLVASAFADGQLYYNSADGSFSNYIGWYSDDAGNYKGFWDKDTGITPDGAPAGATWINRSYIYLGDAGASDMMYVSVRVCTHIASGMQVVQYKIPASLIPKVTYEVELEGSDASKMTSIKRIGADPLRLVYEVGLQDGINSVNVAEKTANLPEGVHVHKNEDGTYAFYTNLWGNGDGSGNVDYSNPLGHQVAQSHFHPAEGNERYYYTEDTPIYTEAGGNYTLYTGSAAPAGQGYYRAWHYYTAEGYTTKYIPVDATSLSRAIQKEDGWYIPQGEVFQQLDRFHMAKNPNVTGTLSYFNYPVVVNLGNTYDVYAFLGNNGKLTLKPAQGIKLSKIVDQPVDGAPDTFTFRVSFDSEVSPTVTDANGNAVTGWTLEGTVLTLQLKAGESVYITDLPSGLGYTVTEEPSRYYVATSTNATGTVIANTVNPVDFVNVPRGYGNLIVSKDVDHPFVTPPAAMSEKEFTIHVKLSGQNVANQTFAIAGSEQTVATDENGVFTVFLKENGSLTVTGLPEGTIFQASETLDPENHKGFAMDVTRSVLTGTVLKDQTVQAHVVNVYTPSEVRIPAVGVAGSKVLVDEAGVFDWTDKYFTFRLEQYDAATGHYTQVGDVQVTEGSLGYSFVLPPFSQLGTFYFKVSEVIPQERLEGMSYDATTGRFEVIVTDEDVDGELELKVVDFDTGAEITPVDGVITYTKNFTNIHSTDATFVEFTACKEVVDPHNTGVTGAGFLFELYETTNGSAGTTADYSMRTQLVNGQGQATFHIPTTKVGVRTFLLKEAEPLDGEKIPGMIYDQTVYTVTVTTTAEDGKLVSVATVTKDGEPVENPKFVNTVDLEPIVLKPYVTKSLLGREPLANDSFSFHLEQTDGSFVPGSLPGGYSDNVTVDYASLTENGGKAYYTEIPIAKVGTYYFRSTEVAGTQGGITYDSSIYHITVDITYAGGQLQKHVTYVKVGQGDVSTENDSVRFVNTYANTDSAEITLAGRKVLTGRELIAGEFTFLLEGEGVSQSVTNKADGSFSFAPIVYTVADVGTHTYTVTEQKGSKGGITYDERVYTVAVTVADDGYNDLVVTASGAEDIVFNNTYRYTSASVRLSGTKTWTNTDSGAAMPMTGGEFAFALYATDSSFATWGDQVLQITNAADGSLDLSLGFYYPGSYYYLLSEVIPEDADRIPGTGYDTGVYEIAVRVSDDGVGALHASLTHLRQVGTGADRVVFANTFTPEPAQVTLTGSKTLTGRTLVDGEFSFLLSDGQQDLQTVQNVDGQFTFAPLTFERSGVYTYTVREQIPEEAVNHVYRGITYDPSLLTVTVTVVENSEGKLVATVAVTEDGKAAELEFTNSFTHKQVSAVTAPAVNIDGKTVALGEVLLYTIHYTNTHEEAMTVTVTDTVPRYTTYEVGSADQGGVYSNGKLTWTFTAEPGETVSVQFKVKVQNVAGVTVRNQAQVAEGDNTYQTNEVTNHTDPADPTNPKTGDLSRPALMLGLFGVSALSVAVMLAVLIRNKKREIAQ